MNIKLFDASILILIGIINNSQNDIDSVMSRTVVPWQNKEPNIMITPQVRVHGPEGIIISGPMAIPRPDFREGTEILVPPEVKGPQVHIFPKAEPKSMDDLVMTSEGVSNPGKTRVQNILDNMPELTGSNREKLLSTIQNKDLSKIVNELYRPGAKIGDGGTAAALVDEFNRGSSKHLQKARERVIQLEKVINSNKLGLNDLDIAEALLKDLEEAINLFK